MSAQERTQEPLHNAPPKTEEQERNAMRAFLQRSEVRLSTMHRVAVGFISGAGLLFLLPVFLKDAVLGIIKEILAYSPTIPVGAGTGGFVALIATYLLVLYPFILSLSIPALALVLLLKDIVRFYFMGHAPGFPEEHFNPRFILTGLAFSPDESESAKTRILMHQYGSDLINFVLSYDERRHAYYGDLIDKPKRMIVPRSRKLPRLIQRGVVDNISGKSLDDLDDNDVVQIRGAFSSAGNEIRVLPEAYKQRTVKEIDRFNAALGLSGFLERPLVEEVAKTEVSLVRHALHLRQMVLRYFQAILILLWTSLISFMLLPFIQDARHRFPVLIVMSIGFFIWAVFTPLVVRMPVYWLARYSKRAIRRSALRELQRKDDLEGFENLTRILCYIAILASAAGIVLSFWLRFA